MKMFYKECEFCSYNISKLKSFSYKKDLGIHTLQCPNCKALYILKGKISRLKISEMINIIFGLLDFSIAFLIARAFVCDNILIFITLFFLVFVILSFIFSIIQRYLDLLVFANLSSIKDIKTKDNWLKKIKYYIFYKS